MNTPHNPRKTANPQGMLQLALQLAAKAASVEKTEQVRVAARDAEGNVTAVLLFASGPSAAELWALFDVAEAELENHEADEAELAGLEPDPIDIDLDEDRGQGDIFYAESDETRGASDDENE